MRYLEMQQEHGQTITCSLYVVIAGAVLFDCDAFLYSLFLYETCALYIC